MLLWIEEMFRLEKNRNPLFDWALWHPHKGVSILPVRATIPHASDEMHTWEMSHLASGHKKDKKSQMIWIYFLVKIGVWQYLIGIFSWFPAQRNIYIYMGSLPNPDTKLEYGHLFFQFAFVHKCYFILKQRTMTDV